ncbi:MAG TPA: PHP domain-containing protein [Oscillospiraceae bacterium]|nr:PHP domain-containing protein [Oscillospiraceae bacterium]HPF56709.1 PHP domain-containing protein [Clostridiales bacterium]HPK35902.1 PHP domain-containing protein [Oscillospiraceae bacterium]HPR76463.1 PHP domain-containing protein [Oscillospiraceae bacterium]
MPLQDYHTHTNISFDSDCPLETLIESRRTAGIDYMAVTDHADFSADDPEINRLDNFLTQFSEQQRFLETQKGNGIDIAFGIEIGQPVFCPENASELISALPFDVVLASQHEVPHKEDFYFVDFTGGKNLLLLDEYFNLLCDVIAWGDFDVLAHMTYPFRQMYRQGLQVDETRWSDAVKDVLKLVIKANKALEINLSPVPEGFEPMPTKKILAAYKDLGGKLITIGTDDHKAQYADHCRVGAELAKSLGFESFTVYHKREPHQVRFD